MRTVHIYSFKKLVLKGGDDTNSIEFECKDCLFLKFFKCLNLNGKARVEESQLNIQAGKGVIMECSEKGRKA